MEENSEFSYAGIAKGPEESDACVNTNRASDDVVAMEADNTKQEEQFIEVKRKSKKQTVSIKKSTKHHRSDYRNVNNMKNLGAKTNGDAGSVPSLTNGVVAQNTKVSKNVDNKSTKSTVFVAAPLPATSVWGSRNSQHDNSNGGESLRSLLHAIYFNVFHLSVWHYLLVIILLSHVFFLLAYGIFHYLCVGSNASLNLIYFILLFRLDRILIYCKEILFLVCLV